MEEGNPKLYGNLKFQFLSKANSTQSRCFSVFSLLPYFGWLPDKLSGFIRQQNWTQCIQSSNKLVHLVPEPCVATELLSSASPASQEAPLSPDKRRKSPPGTKTETALPVNTPTHRAFLVPPDNSRWTKNLPQEKDHDQKWSHLPHVNLE